MRRSISNRSLATLLRLAVTAEKNSLSHSQESEFFDRWFFEQEVVRRSRREIIKQSALALTGATLALAGCKTTQSSELRNQEKLIESDIVILGGGLGGLTCAYRLWQVGVSTKVYEASSRLGGRVFTARNFNADRQFCEVGAELVDSTNYELIELAKELGLEAEGYAENDPVEGETELFFFDKKVYTGKEFYSALRPFLASVAEDLKRIFPDDQIYWPSFNGKKSDLLVRYDHTSLDEYFASKAKTTEPWVLRALRRAYETEYGGALARQSSLNFICLADTKLEDGFNWYGASDEWGRIKGGNQGLIDKMEASLISKIPIYLKHELIAISHNGTRFKLVFNVDGQTKEVVASKVVCGLPFSVLRKIDGISKLELSQTKRRSIQELAYGTNAKFMSSYNERIWRQNSNNLPASQAVVMTDLKGGQYWETSRIQSGKSGIITNFLGGLEGARVTDAHLATILSDLDTLWPGLKAKHDGKAKLMAWTREKYAMGSYSSPAPGQYTTFIGCEGLPEINDSLYFVGEHASTDWIGYMNGAIQTGNQVAFRIAGKTQSNITLEQQSGLGLTSNDLKVRRRKWKKQ